jgi:post-segregation antitoxin (ccd killing protein)
MKCSNCGHESNKIKLTLSIDRGLVTEGKAKGINLSELMEETLAKHLKSGDKNLKKGE